MLLLVALHACAPNEPYPRVLINEVMSANDSAVRDPASPECPEFDDWVEVVNAGSVPVDLTGITLWASDAWVELSGGLNPGEHRLVWADDQLEQGIDHAPFKVSADGERLMLRRGERVLDVVDVPGTVPRDHSWARVRDGDPEWAQVKVSTPGEPNHRVLPSDPCFATTAAFDDHSYPCLSTDDSYVALAGDRTELRVVKFDIFDFDDPGERRVAFVDTEFYTLHDQFYLFRMFNGQPFPGIPDHSPFPGSFRTWGELDAWARTVELSTLVDTDMASFSGERLYSRTFYRRINGHPRDLGVGTVIHRPATADEPAFWGFELEHGDEILYEDLVVYFEVLEAEGPPAFADIHWLVRSAFQEDLAVQLEQDGLLYGDRITRYSELATPGEVEVYHPGLTAGKVRRYRAGEPGLEDSAPTDILLLEEIPDELPPCAALITSVPQTPLSHISLLARSRGIPNLYVAGITDDAEWDSFARRRAWIVLDAPEDGALRFEDIGVENYLFWQTLQAESLPELIDIDPETLPWAYDLASAPSMRDLRPEVGGKAAGMRQLLLEPIIDTPDTPMGLTIRGYHRHLAAFPWLDELLFAPPFTTPDALAERYLVLEGREAYDGRYAGPGDQTTADAFLADHEGEILAELASGDGLRGRVADTPMPEEVAEALLGELAGQFAWLSTDQGLRVRSSSTIEDIEGFNGAGLYISETGFLEPADGDRPLEEAIRAVWASYWGAEAFEEREAAGIPHLAGGMGLLVHPRFDDEFELSNAVFTASRLPDGSLEVLINTQEGAVSVANPPTTCPAVLPESLRLSDADGTLSIERVGASSEVPEGQEVLSDSQAEDLFVAAGLVVDAWLATENEVLPEAQQRSVLTLDLESREMAAGWPRGSEGPPRLVVKQSRSLEPSAAGLPDDILDLPAPRDLLARATVIERLSCSDDEVYASVVGLRTDPRELPDMGYGSQVFVIEAELDGVGEESTWDHLSLDEASVADGGFGFRVGTLLVDMGDSYRIEADGEVLTGTAVCEGETLWASPDQFLLGFF